VHGLAAQIPVLSQAIQGGESSQLLAHAPAAHRAQLAHAVLASYAHGLDVVLFMREGTSALVSAVARCPSYKDEATSSPAASAATTRLQAVGRRGATRSPSPLRPERRKAGPPCPGCSCRLCFSLPPRRELLLSYRRLRALWLSFFVFSA